MKDLILITGGNGIVGQILIKSFNKSHFDILHLHHSRNYSNYSLPKLTDMNKYERITVIHSGQPKAPRSLIERVNYKKASCRLFKESIEKNFSVIFVSSMSAHNGNLSYYSKDKKYLENMVINYGGCVIRLGLVESKLSSSPYFKVKKLYKQLNAIGLTNLVNFNSYEITKAQDLSDFISFSEISKLKGYLNIASSSFELKDINSFKLSKKTFCAFRILLVILSRLNLGRADAFLNLSAGMRNDVEE
jgi:dTDP-4-dehydrorhamnose reductase